MYIDKIEWEKYKTVHYLAIKLFMLCLMISPNIALGNPTDKKIDDIRFLQSKYNYLNSEMLEYYLNPDTKNKLESYRVMDETSQILTEMRKRYRHEKYFSQKLTIVEKNLNTFFQFLKNHFFQTEDYSYDWSRYFNQAKEIINKQLFSLEHNPSNEPFTIAPEYGTKNYIWSLIPIFNREEAEPINSDKEDEVYTCEGVNIICNINVIANKLKKEDVKGIFLKQKTLWQDATPVKFAILDKSDIRDFFFSAFIGMPFEEYQELIEKKDVSSKDQKAHRVRRFNTEKELIEYISNTDGAVGFVSPKGYESNKQSKIKRMIILK